MTTTPSTKEDRSEMRNEIAKKIKVLRNNILLWRPGARSSASLCRRWYGDVEVARVREASYANLGELVRTAQQVGITDLDTVILSTASVPDIYEGFDEEYITLLVSRKFNDDQFYEQITAHWNDYLRGRAKLHENDPEYQAYLKLKAIYEYTGE